MLRDGLVCGINSDRIQRRLLAEKDITFVKALVIAMPIELTEESAADLYDSTSKGTRSVSGTSEGDVNIIKKRKSFKDTKCRFCHSKGHVQRFCKRRREARSEQTRVLKQKCGRKQDPIKNVKDDTDSETEMYTTFRTQGKEKSYTVQVSLDGVLTETEVDAGASLSVISEETLALSLIHI